MRLEPRSNNTPRARLLTARRRAHMPTPAFGDLPLLRFAVRTDHAAVGTELLKFESSRIVLLVLLRGVVSLLALAASQRHNLAIQFLCHGVTRLSVNGRTRGTPLQTVIR